MICLFHKLWNRRRVRKREIRRLMRKMPVLGVPADADFERLAMMVKSHSFTVRFHRLYSRYSDGKMSCANLTKYRRMLESREVIVNDIIGTSFAVDRKVVARVITRFRKMVG